MKVTKIYCDCCDAEFAKTDNDRFGDVDVNVMEENRSSMDKPKRIITRFKSGDICGVCVTKIYEFINELKNKDVSK